MTIKTMMALSAILSLAAGCLTSVQKAAGRYEGTASAAAPKHIVFVGMDGFAGNTLAAADAPNLKKLISEGSWTAHSRSILPSASACCWHSIFTCSASEQHGYNAWNSQKPVFAPSTIAANGKYPDIMYLLRQREPEAEIGFIYDWGGMGFTADTNACSYARQMPQKALTTAAIKYITEKKPRFFAVCYDSPDNFGHKNGWGSPEYLNRVKELDAELGKILKAIADAGMLDDTVVMVTSDHGGINKKHGGATLSEMERPLVIWGKGVRRNHELSFPGTNYDTGATIAALLGIDPPVEWIGRPLDEAFVR